MWLIASNHFCFSTDTNIPLNEESESDKTPPVSLCTTPETSTDSQSLTVPRFCTTPVSTSEHQPNTTPCSALPPQATPTTSRKRKKVESDIDKLDTEITKLDFEMQNFKKDEAGVFGESVAAKLRSFTPYQVALARRNIENVLFEIQFGSAQNQDASVSISSETYFTNL